MILHPLRTTNFFLALILFALASCATVGTPTANKLAGKWRSAQGRQTAEYLFLTDGTFTGRVISNGALVSDFAGSWSLRAGTILYEYRSDRLGRIAVGTLDRDKLLAVADDYYLIEAADGSRRKYLRITN